MGFVSVFAHLNGPPRAVLNSGLLNAAHVLIRVGFLILRWLVACGELGFIKKKRSQKREGK